MNKRKNFIKVGAIVISIVVILQMGCKQNIQPLRLATYTYATNSRIDNLKPLSKVLEKALERSVEIKSYTDVASFIEGIKSDEVDIGLINTLGYLLLSLDNKNMDPIVALKIEKDVIDNYKTLVLTNNTSIENLDDLKLNVHELTMMFVAEGSTSGNLIPRLLLSSLGLKEPENQFKEVKYGGNHKVTFEKFIRGESDLCAIGSNEYFKQIGTDSSLLNSHNVLWTSEEIPLGPVLLNNNLTTFEKEIIVEAFLNLHQIDYKALETLKSGWSEAKGAERFHRVSDANYSNFRTMNGNSTDMVTIIGSLKN